MTCGQLLHMDSMLLRPAQGISEDQTHVGRMPWLERKQRGIFKAWFQTVWKSLFDPMSLMRGVPVEEPGGSAWMYALITMAVFLIGGAGAPMAALALFATLMRGGGREEFLLFGGSIVLGGTVGMLALIGIWGATAHAILHYRGRPAYPIRRTYQALLYSVGANAPLATPCLSLYCAPFTWIWWGISATFMLVQGQRVSALRAAVAIFAFPSMMFFIGLATLIAAIVIDIRSSPQAFAAFSQAAEIRPIAASISAHASMNKGQGPAHALELMNSANLGSAHFVSPYSATDSTAITIAQSNVAQLDYLPPNRKASAIQAAANCLPANVVAHRCGDFVFTYHGIDFSTCDPTLWTVIQSPDPDFNSSAATSLGTYVGLADGTVRHLRGTFANDLAKQNQLRANYALPPLPDPSIVTHDTPAVTD